MGVEFSSPLQGVSKCPHCGVTNPLLTEKWSSLIEYNVGARSYGTIWATYICSKCDQITLARGSDGELSNGSTSRFHKRIDRFYPSAATVDDSLPPSAKSYLQQALDTLSSPDASIVMSASAVDSMLKAKNYNAGTLYNRIDAAVKDHVLTESMGKWAHMVRLEANSVRHADDVKPHANEQEARQVVEFAKALGDFLFVFTSRIDKGIKDAAPEEDETS